LRLHYDVYGLHLSANIEIPGLDAEKVDKGVPDIELHLGILPDGIKRHIDNSSTGYHLEPGNQESDPPHRIVNLLDDGKYFHISYVDGVEFVLDRNATVVWGVWKAPLVLEDVALFLLGPVIGFMLRLRGVTCLHASGVVVNGQSFALTGPSGAGKSTLAACFATEGYSILTDDVLPLQIENDKVYTRSGYSRLRLYPHSYENLKELPDSLPLLAPFWDKHYLDLALDSYDLYKSPSLLKVIYIIDWNIENRTGPPVENLTGVEAVPLLAANTYRNELLSPEMRANEFAFLSQLASRIKIKSLYPTDDISAVPKLRDILLKDFHQETDEHVYPQSTTGEKTSG